MKSPCNECEKDTSCTYICPQFTEWFVRTWDDMVAKYGRSGGCAMTRAERAALREQGYTLQAIADREGVSKQAVHQSLTTEYRPATLERVVYPAVKRWMIENRISIAKLNRMLGLPHDGGYHVRTAKFLKGEVCHKDLIDGVLRLSGMKYEEAFAE